MSVSYQHELSECTKDNTPWFSFEGQGIYCKVIHVYDGDTITVIAPFMGSKFYKVKCRLSGIDTPEIRTRNLEEKAAGFKAKQWVADHILDKVIWLQCGKHDKYGRMLGRIYMDRDEKVSLNELIVSEGFAKKYDGGRRTPYKKNSLK